MAEVENITATEEVAAEQKQPRADRNNRSGKKFERRPRRERPQEKSDGLDKKMVAVNRISKTVKGGRKMRFNAVVVVGDHNGKVGLGMAKAAEVTIAIEKATNSAKKHIITVPIVGTTIPHETIGKFETTKILMMPSKEGKGVIAGGAVRDVMEMAGVKDITTKSYGSNNPVNCVKATFEGLKQLRSADEIAAIRGKSAEEIR
jgi:small subunit ribosomal protein S5